jgi:hypothetical protein
VLKYDQKNLATLFLKDCSLPTTNTYIYFICYTEYIYLACNLLGSFLKSNLRL